MLSPILLGVCLNFLEVAPSSANSLSLFLTLSPRSCSSLDSRLGFFSLRYTIEIADPTWLILEKETLSAKKDDRDIGRILGHVLVKSCCQHRRLKNWKWQGDDETTPLLPEAAKKKPKQEDPPSYREVFTHQSNLNLVAYTLLALHSVAYDQLIPVFLHLPPQSDRAISSDVQLPFKFAGGFGLDVSPRLETFRQY